MTPLYAGSQSYMAVWTPPAIGCFVIEFAVYTDLTFTEYDTDNYLPGSRAYTTDPTLFPVAVSLVQQYPNIGLKKFVNVAGTWSQEGATIQALPIDSNSPTYGAVCSFNTNNAYATEMAVYTDSGLTMYSPDYLPDTDMIVFDPLNLRQTLTELEAALLNTGNVGIEQISGTLFDELDEIT